jgi:uncharacterized membrane protein YbaN (DUF454 family)
MNARIKYLLIFSCGWLFVILGLIGLLLPVIPTFPFMLVALACFSRTSPRFHDMLLKNRWIGRPLTQWDQTKTVRRKTKMQALLMLSLAFSGSFIVLWGHLMLQLVVLALAAVMIGFVVKLKEAEPKYDS